MEDILQNFKEELYTKEQIEGEKYKKEIVKNAKKISFDPDAIEKKNFMHFAKKAKELTNKENANNLLNKFSGISYYEDIQPKRKLGIAFYTLFIDKKEKEAFDMFVEIKLPYAVTSYYMFLFNPIKYMPLRVDIMNTAFEKMGFSKILQRGKYDYDNYIKYIDTMNELKRRLKLNSLLEVHDFVWIVGYHFVEKNKTKVEQLQAKTNK
jgi:hypothetical protein